MTSLLLIQIASRVHSISKAINNTDFPNRPGMISPMSPDCARRTPNERYASNMNSLNLSDRLTTDHQHQAPPQDHRQQSAHPTQYYPLSFEAFHQLIQHAGDGQVARDLKDIATIVYFTGIRPGELKRLAWHDVNLERHIMLVGSKGATKRAVPFNQEVHEVLIQRGKIHAGSEYVLGKSPEAALGRISQRLRSLPCGVDGCKLTLQALRNSFAMNWLKVGGSLEILKAIMGFSSYSTMKAIAAQHWGCQIAGNDSSQLCEEEPI